MRKRRLSQAKPVPLLEHVVAGTTAYYYFHRLRSLIAEQLEKEETVAFSGEIEVDGSY